MDLLRNSPSLGCFADGRDNNFNILRMVAAMGVLVSHAYPISTGEGAIDPLQPYLQGLSLGFVSVMVFFGISGFLIARSFDRSSSLERFFMARVLRLFPALFVVLIVTVIAAAFWVREGGSTGFLLEALTYIARNLSLYALQYELSGVFEANPLGSAINGSLWTLNHEVTCYLGVVVVGLIGGLRNRMLMLVAVAAFASVYAAVTIFEPHPNLNALLQLALPFFVGMCLYVWRNRIPLSPTIGLGLIALCLIAHQTYLFHEIFAASLVYWVFLAAYLPGGLVRRYNELGDYSYGVYVYAFPLQQLMTWAYGPISPEMNIALATPATLLCAVLSWSFIERPALDLARRDRKPVQERA